MISEFLSFATSHYKSIAHPLDVASVFNEGSDGWIVGLFHDLLEDTDLEEAELKQFLQKHQKEFLLKDIVNITRLQTETYFDYICRLDGLAKTVKIVDLKRNLAKKDTLKVSLEKRYTKALELLVDSPQ